jgi:hypothetical protein
MNQPLTIDAAELATVHDSDAPRIYAGTMQVLSSFFEFVLILGQLEAGLRLGEGGTQPRIREVGQIYLSPQHAKAVAQVLAQKVNEYEAQYGHITTIQEAIASAASITSQPQPSSQSRAAARASDSPPAPSRPSSRRAAPRRRQQGS